MLSRFATGFLSIVLAASAAPLFAQQLAGVDLARTKSCLACHQVDDKRVGPSFRAIAERFAGSSAAQDYLAASIREGSRGRWGAVPMPAQRQVNAADSQLLAAWIISMAPQAAAGKPAPAIATGGK